MPLVEPARPGRPQPATLSACLIVRDEQQSLPDCLASIAFCHEIVVVDSGSRDNTVAIAHAAGARVVSQPWLGFAAQRNVALDHASGEWVLEIDADERVSPALRAEIEAFLEDPPAGVDLGGLPRREILVGHRLGPSAKYPKYGHRLLRRGAYRHDEARTVHEGLTPEGAVAPFEGELIHLLARSWREAVGDAWRYARLEAGQMGAPSSLGACLRGAFARPAVKLAYRLLVDGGWRDGWAGLAKISLDCATDTVVWMRHLLGRRGSELGSSGITGDAHYGSRKFHLGNVRVVGVALDPAAAAMAHEWLGGAREAGADAALIAPPAGDEAAEEAPAVGGARTVRERPLAHVGPLTLIRALEAEEQLRSIDAVVPFGWRARLALRAAPHGLRGARAEIRQESDPRAVNWTIREHANADAR
jgi:glycosyltransferase involved in cell wall biosynthesis